MMPTESHFKRQGYIPEYRVRSNPTCGGEAFQKNLNPIVGNILVLNP